MAVPTSRSEFKEYVLRSLGKPVVEINVSEEQVDDRIDEALKWYGDYHFDASEKVYYKHQITDTDKTNKYITLPDNILGVVNLFPISDSNIRVDDIFSIRYQIALNDLYTLTSVSMVPYYMMREHLALLNELLVGKQPIRYSRHRQRLYIDMDWSVVNTGEYLVVEAYEVIDPDEFTAAWGDRFLYRYSRELIKKQWGENLKKFSGMQLPGGVQFNGQQIYDEADVEIKKIEQEMINNYSLPCSDFVG